MYICNDTALKVYKKIIIKYTILDPSLQFDIDRWQLKTGQHFTIDLIGYSRIYD